MILSTDQLTRLALSLAHRHRSWDELIKPDPERRVYEQVWNDASANAWLICWSRDHDTGWHDHDDAAASIAVLHGQVRDERMRLRGRPVSRLLEPGESFCVPPAAIHRVRHAGNGPAVTVHCYSPPLRRTGAYSVGTAGELLRSPQPFEQELRALPAML